MKLIAYSFLLLVILEQSYCKSTSSFNKTSTSWGYDYNENDTRGFKVKHDDKGYQFEPFYNNTSSDLKNYNYRSVSDQFTSPGATNESQSHSSTNDVINGTSKGITHSRSNGTAPNKVLFDTSAGGKNTTEFRRVPLTKMHTETQSGAPIATDKTSPYDTPSSSHSIPVGDVKRYPNVPSNGQLYKTTFGTPYGSQNTPMYGAPTGPEYYPQGPSYGQMTGPGAPFGSQNTPMFAAPTGPFYYPQGPSYGQMTGPGAPYRSQNTPLYAAPTGPEYDPQGPSYGQMNGPGAPYGSQNTPMYAAPTGPEYYPQSPSYGQMYGPGAPYGSQNTPMYAAPTGPLYYPQAPSYGQMYVPGIGLQYVPIQTKCW